MPKKSSKPSIKKLEKTLVAALRYFVANRYDALEAYQGKYKSSELWSAEEIEKFCEIIEKKALNVAYMC
jgi:hypothetical protein